MGSRHTDFLRLFTRSRRSRRSAKTKPITLGDGHTRITDALGATRAMCGEPPGGGTSPEEENQDRSRPPLKVILPPTMARLDRERHFQVSDRRIRLSMGYLACGMIAVALCLLVLASFVMGMRYQASRQGAAGLTALGPEDAGHREGGRSVGTPGNVGGQRPSGPIPVGLPGTDNAPQNPPRPAGTSGTPGRTGRQLRLRILTLPLDDRPRAEKSLATLRERGVSVLLVERLINSRRQLVLYSEQQFASATSAEATALLNKVRLIMQEGRYDFASAYYVEAD